MHPNVGVRFEHAARWRVLMLSFGIIFGLAWIGASAQAAEPAATSTPSAAASAPRKISPHALAAIQRAKAASEPQSQAGFTMLAHGRPHRPGSRTHTP